MDNLNTVAFEVATPINIWGDCGGDINRLMAVYKTKGCFYGKNGKGCTMCNFAFYADNNVNENNITTQHNQILSQLAFGKYAQFDLLTLGNFFNDQEISPELRMKLLRPLAEIPTLKRVLIESRYKYTYERKLLDAKKCLRPDQVLEFAFGYEAVTEQVRNGVLNKGVKEEHLDSILRFCEIAGVDFVAYVLIKPHKLSEYEGIMEAANTAVHILEKSKKYNLRARIAFEPVFVTKGKEIEYYFLNRDYTPPKLWSVIDVLRKTIDELGSDFREGCLFVGMSDENLSGGRVAANCGDCDPKVLAAIREFNGTQDIAKLLSLTCNCKEKWEILVQNQY